jgi:hypothetical protein
MFCIFSYCSSYKSYSIHEKYDMKTDMKSEMHNFGYLLISTVTSHYFADFFLGKFSLTYSRWKSFLVKFTRLAHSQQWTGDELDDHFCLCLDGIASAYYTLLMVPSPNPSLKKIFGMFKKRFGSSVTGIAHQLNFQSFSRSNGETLRQWVDRILLAFPTLADVHPQTIKQLCFGAEDHGIWFYICFGWAPQDSREKC